MLSLDWIWDRRNRVAILSVSGVIVLAVAVVDWWTKPYFSLGFLYLFPIMLAAGFLPRWGTVVLGVVCAALSERFSNLDPSDSHIRLGFEALALCGCGLLTSEVLRNRRLSLESQQRMRVLVETSPAAIVTVDERGFIELANRAAGELLAPKTGDLIGQPVAAFLPELHHALRWEEGPQFRTSMQCRGHRGDGESFLAEVWFSTYKEGTTPKLAAIIAYVTESRLSRHALAPPWQYRKTGHRSIRVKLRFSSWWCKVWPTRKSRRIWRSQKRGQELPAAVVRENRCAHPRPTRARRSATLPRFVMNR